MKKEEYNYPKNSTGNLIWEIIWPLGVYLLSGVVVGFILGIVLMIMLGQSGTEKFLNNNAVLLNVLSQIITLGILIPIYLNRKKYIPAKKMTIKEEPKKTIIYVLTIISISIISGYIFAIIEKLIKMPDGGLGSINEMFNSSGIIPAVLTAVILAPVLEEIIFRGLIFNKLNSKLSTTAAIIISALIFGIYHMNIVQGLNAFVLGIVFAYIYSKTYNLWICIIAHFVNNLLSLILQRISYITYGDYVSNTTISTVLQIGIVIVTGFLILKNKKLLGLEKVSEKTK